MRNVPAYQGRGWQARRLSLDEELRAPGQKIWSDRRTNSEWAPLKTILVYQPEEEVFSLKNPLRAQHLRPLDPKKTKSEYRAIRGAFTKLGIEVLELRPEVAVPPNLMFVRDLFFNTTAGCVVSRMASTVRAGEERFASSRLSQAGVPIVATIAGHGLFEGADALWLNPQIVLCGLGARTNQAGFLQLRAVLKLQDVLCIPIKMPGGVQHLLGILQIVGPRTALVRIRKAPPGLIRLLRRHDFEIIAVEETSEVGDRQAMNFVTIAERRVVMAADCPDFKAFLIKNKIKIAAELSLSQLINAAGGLACATGILARRLVK